MFTIKSNKHSLPRQIISLFFPSIPALLFHLVLTLNILANDTIIIKPALETKPLHEYDFMPYYPIERPKIGLAFSGGGANGIAQIGVLQVLYENEIPIDYIVGTSMGSLIGGLYAAGYTPYEIESMMASFDWTKVLIDRPERQTLFIEDKQARDQLLFQIRFNGLKPVIPPAITPGQQIENLITQYVMRAHYVATNSFDDLRIPFRAISTDLISGKKVILKQGNLSEAIRASISFPLLFAPVEVDGMLLVDGGMTENIPVEALQEFPVDITIAVDATTNLRTRDQLNAPWEIADQVTSIMQRDRNEKSRKMADVVIRLQDSTRTNMQFDAMRSLIWFGRVQAENLLPQIKKKIESFEKYTPGTAEQQAYPISKVLNFPVNFHYLLEKNIGKEGHYLLLTKSEIQAILNTIYQSGNYAFLQAELILNPTLATYELNINTETYPLLEKVMFEGNRVINSDTLRSQISELVDKPLNNTSTQRALKNILMRYREAGFALAKITNLSYDPISHTGSITIDEGHVGRILIEGKHRTLNHVILREFPLQKGDVYNYDKAKNGINNIIGTGLFSRVSASLKSTPEGVDILLRIQEKSRNVLSGSARFDLERRARGFIQMADENVAGLGGKLVFQGLFGANDNGLRTRFSVDRIFKTYFTFASEAYWTIRNRKTYVQESAETIGKYQENQLGAFVSIGQLFRRFGIVSAELHIDQFNLDAELGTGFPTGLFNINRLIFRSIVDTRDRLPFPYHGRHATFFYETSIKSGIKNSSFVRTAWNFETYYTIKQKHTLHPKFSFGTSDFTTPFVFRYYFNGPEDMYGLKDEQWRGRHFLLGNFEYRYELFSKFSSSGYLGIRYDIGGIWDTKTDNLKYSDDLSKAVGVYLGFRTFLGVIKLAYGQMESEFRRFYISIGHEF
ncbi:MAG: patatin-like phospholipase family protein [Deferribacteres bacterium]|nr:patatin-like phospholipase family protein [Deferribacteres bacterium]